MKFLGTAQIWVVDGINMKGHIIHPQEIKVNPMVSSEAATATLRSNMWRPTAVSYQSIGWFCGTTTPTTSWRLGWKLPFQQVELQRDEIEKDRLGGVNCKYIIYCIKTHIIWYLICYCMYLYDAHTHRYIYIVGAGDTGLCGRFIWGFWHVTWDLCINFAMGLLITNHGGYAPT